MVFHGTVFFLYLLCHIRIRHVLCAPCLGVRAEGEGAWASFSWEPREAVTMPGALRHAPGSPLGGELVSSPG